MQTVLANATSTAALWPGSLGGVFGFLDEIRQERRLLILLLIPSLIGGLLGAFILVSTPESLFRRIVPFLVLFATLLFAGRDQVTRLMRRNGSAGDGVNLVSGLWGMLFQTVISIYGGYFGAGQSILMMAVLSIIGLRDIHRINGLKTALALTNNGIALIFFALAGKVLWPYAIVMGIGAILGGYGAARISKRIDQKVLRATVVVIGLLVSVWLFLR